MKKENGMRYMAPHHLYKLKIYAHKTVFYIFVGTHIKIHSEPIEKLPMEGKERVIYAEYICNSYIVTVITVTVT